jgi:hypothetical protein
VLGHQDAVAARPHPLLVAIGYVPERIIGRIGDRRVLDFFQRKSLTWVLDFAQHHVAGSHVRDLDVLGGIEVPTVFHRIEQDFAKSHAYVVFLFLWQIRDLPHEQ